MSDEFRQRYEALKRSVVDLGYFRRGSLVRRFMPCGKPGCVCQGPQGVRHGPYYDWTRKVRGKTVSVRLSPEQAKSLSEWINTGRRLNQLIAQMERLSLRATERALRELATDQQPSQPASRARRKPPGGR